MLLLPEWNSKFDTVRLDADGEVVMIGHVTGYPITNDEYYSLGYFDGVRHSNVYALTGKPEWFVGRDKAATLAGYPFDRFEYEVYRAVILQEQEDAQTQERSS